MDIDVEDSLRLINYIKAQQAKGFSRDEIREKLDNAGWKRREIEYYTSDAIFYHDIHADIALELIARYGKFLLEGEEITSYFHIGLNSMVLITNHRFIFLRKFPRMLKAFYFKDIELVEYFTIVQWSHLGYSLFYLGFASAFLKIHHILWKQLVSFLPFTSAVLNFKVLADFNLPALIIAGYLLFYFVSDAYFFATSFIGKLRILPKHLGPVDIMTPLTSEIEHLIQRIEEKIVKEHV